MGRTNADVGDAFREGKEAHSMNMSSRHEDGATLLYSYRTVIALRREDGRVFANGHRFTVTTGSKHQTQIDPSAVSVSFTALAELMGADWWRDVSVLDQGPDYCRNAACEQERADQYSLYRAGLLAEYPDTECWRPNEGDAHAIRIPDYHGGQKSAVLLSWRDGRQVICGEEAGKAIKYGGRTDQLWAALLSTHAYDIRLAFGLLAPSAVRHYRDVDVAGWPDLHERKPVQRQGDLYFIPSYDGPPKGALKIDGVGLPLLLGAAGRASHIASRARLALSSAGEAQLWARGNVDHHEHPRLRLAMWHRVYRSAAVRAVSSPLQGGGGAYGD